MYLTQEEAGSLLPTGLELFKGCQPLYPLSLQGRCCSTLGFEEQNPSPRAGGFLSSSSPMIMKVVTVWGPQHPSAIPQLPQSSLQGDHLTALELGAPFFHACGGLAAWWAGGFDIPSPLARTGDA